MGLLKSLFSNAAGIAMETISETKSQNETRKFITQMQERDAKYAQENEQIYQEWLNHEKTSYFDQKNKGCIESAFASLIDSFTYTGTFDFSALDQLDSSLKQTDYYIDRAKETVAHYCELFIELHGKIRVSVPFIMERIHDLQYFAIEVPALKSLDRHWNVFYPKNIAEASVLADYDTVEDGLHDIQEHFSDTFYSNMNAETGLINQALQLQEATESGDCIKAVSVLLFAPLEMPLYKEIGKALIFLAMQDSDELGTLLYHTYCDISRKFQMLAVPTEEVGENNPFVSAATHEVLPIDYLIAEIIRFSKTGASPELDKYLDDFLRYYPLVCASSGIEQFSILQKVLGHYKMYVYEAKVLEFLVSNGLEHTEKQERRLAFLKSTDYGKASFSDGSSFDNLSVDTKHNELAYDYRFMSWNASDINAFFTHLTGEESTLQLPVVISEWKKKITQKNVIWSLEGMCAYLTGHMRENFGDKYSAKILNCGAVVGDEVEYEPAVYIEENENGKYPWLSFIVMGDQLTMAQVSFSIYALYLPEKDNNCLQATDLIEKNQKFKDRLMVLKQNQNPRIKNYIESITEILISGLDSWLNDNNTSSMYN